MFIKASPLHTTHPELTYMVAFVRQYLHLAEQQKNFGTTKLSGAGQEDRARCLGRGLSLCYGYAWVERCVSIKRIVIPE